MFNLIFFFFVMCFQDSQPLEMSILEEQAPGTIVGNFTAIDEDIGENSAIDYIFIDGNQEDLFRISRTDDNGAIIVTIEKLDREVASSFLLTVKCFKKGTNPDRVRRNTYNSYDPSEIQILIKVIDIDDHLPEFQRNEPIVGIRSNIAIDHTIITMTAIDLDPDSMPIMYNVQNITFVPQFYKRDNLSNDNNIDGLFSLNNSTGEIRTVRSLGDYVDGYFDVIVRANNSPITNRVVDNHLKIFVIRDKSLLRFVFTRPAAEIENSIKEFAEQVQAKLKVNELELYILDTQVLIKDDHSLDFSSTRFVYIYILYMNVKIVESDKKLKCL